MVIAITGTTGNMGGYFLWALNQSPCAADKIKILCRNRIRAKKLLGNNKAIAHKIEVVVGDLTDEKACRSLVEGCDVVFNICGVIPPKSDSDPKGAIACNVTGVKTLISAIESIESNQPALVHVSSVAVYGNRSFENAIADMADFAGAAGFRTIAAGAFIGEHSYSTPATPIAVGRPDKEDISDAHRFGCLIASKISILDFSEPDIMSLRPLPDPESALNNFRTFVAGYQQEQMKNPKKLTPVTDTTRCNRCGVCADACPTSAIDYTTVDPDTCIKCCACVKACPEGARTLASPFAPVLSANFNTRKSPCWIL